MITIDTGFNQRGLQELTLFPFDDLSLPFVHNLKLTLQQVRKYPGNPVLRYGDPGEPDQGGATFYGTVLREGDLFRMWYLAISPRGHFSKDCFFPAWHGYAESPDGIHWEKPKLGLVEFEGSKENNLVWPRKPVRLYYQGKGTGEMYDKDKYHPSLDYPGIIFDPEDPDPDRRYKMVYVDHDHDSHFEPNGSPANGFFCATSSDGFDWREVPGNPQIPTKYEVSSLYKFNGCYHAIGQQFSPWIYNRDGSVNSHRTSMVYRSADFETWEQGGVIGFDRSREGSTEDTHMGPAMFNKGNVLVGLYGQFHTASEILDYRGDLGLIVSNNGLHFREPVPGFKVIPQEYEGRKWDPTGRGRQAIVQGNGILNVGDETWIWYGTWGDFDQAGLAKLEKERFGCLELARNESEGYEWSSSIAAEGKAARLFLNVDGVSEACPLRVALNDAAGCPLPGYSGDQCVPVTEAGSRLPLDPFLARSGPRTAPGNV